jgi:hypothetical protein
MKDPRRSARARTSSKRVFQTSKRVVKTSRARQAPSTAVKATTPRIADKMQVLALRRPHMLHLVEQLLDGMLSERRRDDRATR